MQLITTDAVSVYQWKDEAAAQRWAAGVNGDQVGVFVLSYAGSEQDLTSGDARTAYRAKVRELIAS